MTTTTTTTTMNQELYKVSDVCMSLLLLFLFTLNILEEGCCYIHFGLLKRRENKCTASLLLQ